MPGKPLVLFLCTGNSARSQMAEAILRHRASDRYEVVSAGTRPADEIHPLALDVLNEAGVATEGQHPKQAKELLGRAPVRHLITVCDAAASECPAVWPGALTREHWPLDDPADAAGTREERQVLFRATRDEIDRRIQDWLTRSAGRPRD
jgi:arsenate reductase